jgi:hypothetical protein
MSEPHTVDFGLERWRGEAVADGYVVGNGRTLLLSGLPRALKYELSTSMSGEPVSRTRIASAIGPSYGDPVVSYGWECLPEVEGTACAWDEERVVAPTAEHPYWGQECRSGELCLRLTDQVLRDGAVLVRQLRLHRPGGLDGIALTLPLHVPTIHGAGGISLDVPVPLRPGLDASWCVEEADAGVPAYARLALDEHPTHRLSCLLTQEAGARTTTEAYGHRLDCDAKAPETVEATLFILSPARGETGGAELAGLLKESAAGLQKRACRHFDPVVERVDGQDDPLLRSLRHTLDLCRSCQTEGGGVLANPYMYRASYIRDNCGPLELFLAVGDLDRARRMLEYFFSQIARHGYKLNHAPDDVSGLSAFDYNPLTWFLDTRWGAVEYPSYMNLFVRDYERRSGAGDLGERLFERLLANLRCQVFGDFQLLPSPGDESYTQLVGIGKQRNFSDSNILFVGAAEYVVKLAERLGRTGERDEARYLATRTYHALLAHTLRPEGWLAVSRDDARPCLDPLLRWTWLDIRDPGDPMVSACREEVLRSLIAPVRVVPDKTPCAGFEPGYLLHALARAGHPAVHEAARMLQLYAGEQGLFSEYYEQEDGRIASRIGPCNGHMRPWESASCARAILQYLLGLTPRLDEARLLLQPHLPAHWPGWRSRAMDLGREGEIRFALILDAAGQPELTIERRGGTQSLTMSIQGCALSEAGDAPDLGARPGQWRELSLPVCDSWRATTVPMDLKWIAGQNCKGEQS